jgi:hypothetical protein
LNSGDGLVTSRLPPATETRIERPGAGSRRARGRDRASPGQRADAAARVERAAHRPTAGPAREEGRAGARHKPESEADDALWARPYGVPGASLVSWRGLPSGLARR